MDRLLLQPGRLRSLRSTALTRASWICASCRHNALPRPMHARGYARAYKPNTKSSTVASEEAEQDAQQKEPSKPYYVTTPIFYVNAAPHVGHMYSMVVADVMKRWHALHNRKALLLTGTDEHGMKIQQAAAAHDTNPKQWCDTQAERFKALAAKVNMQNDFFIRTTDEDHKNAVRHFWFLLREKGFIYESKHEGWYCVSDETYYPESMLIRKLDPLTGEVTMASSETGNTVEWVEEKNYHFRMTAFKGALLEFYKANPTWIHPPHRMAEVVDWVENNLEDLSISRPSTRLEWGIRVPDDESQTIYVWVDALINYLTKAGFPDWAPGHEKEGGWPADLHIIGKDILRFHGVYWPALLLAVDLEPPKKLLSHGHWTMNGKKMSKSQGNVINPFHAIDRWGVDVMRFFMVHDGGLNHDADYDNLVIAERYRKLLGGTIGNMLGRTIRSKLWNVRECVGAAPIFATPIHQEKVPKDLQSLLAAQEAAIGEYCEAANLYMGRPDPRTALKSIMNLAFELNKFFTESKPWELAKEILTINNTPDLRQRSDEVLLYKVHVGMIIYTAAETLRHIAILLQPFMPDKAEEMLDLLGVELDKRSFAYLGVGKDFTYGKPLRPVGAGAYDALFPPLPVEN
ncbi:tRNA synthetases class I (M)-domain-containing protein [Coniella lustricola]|uniref:Probable methionine--tRNA ligase, mitochondrial n=1 Tax=Coniella lustricola TaxID=2025994 RepID=A0A2T3AC53_9PEZI|nr:tRNA synthetases class I (M)-domain-containing protein [Coniella lustricola]